MRIWSTRGFEQAWAAGASMRRDAAERGTRRWPAEKAARCLGRLGAEQGGQADAWVLGYLHTARRFAAWLELIVPRWSCGGARRALLPMTRSAGKLWLARLGKFCAGRHPSFANNHALAGRGEDLRDGEED